MREIIFRGKRKDNGEWVQGFVFGDDLIGSNKMFIGAIIIENGEIVGTSISEVVPESIGQYTGLTDKNGKKIFEGDIVNVNTNKDALYHIYEGRHLVIRFDEYHRFVASGSLEYPLCNRYEWEVIGNIHDNKEILKGEITDA